jgi:hypothetical protein
MDKQKLKEKLHEYIDKLEDEQELYMLHEATVEYKKNENKDITDELTPEQLERLKESIKQADEGKTIPHEEVMKLARTWLQK